MSQSEKNLHLEHFEDEIINRGLEGIGLNCNTATQLLYHFTGQQDPNYVLQFKVDGSPNIIFGINPENGMFFVGTKSVFNKKTPKINYTIEDIDRNHTGDVNRILKLCLKHLSELIPFQTKFGVYSGDFMFDTKKDLAYFGTYYLSWQPNIIMYVIDEDYHMAEHIRKSKMGMFIHTKYEGEKLCDMKATYKVAYSHFRHPANVWAPVANYSELKKLPELDDVVRETMHRAIKRMKNLASFKIEPNNFKYVVNDHTRPLLKRFMNERVREGKFFLHDTKIVNEVQEFLTFIREHYFVQISDLSTPKVKLKKLEEMELLIYVLRTNYELLCGVFEYIRAAYDFKMKVIKYLGGFKFLETWIKDEEHGGYKETNPEGFIWYDGYTNYTVKLVDRLMFSRANFAMHATQKP